MEGTKQMFSKRHEEELAEIKALTLELSQRFEVIQGQLERIEAAQQGGRGATDEAKSAGGRKAESAGGRKGRGGADGADTATKAKSGKKGRRRQGGGGSKAAAANAGNGGGKAAGKGGRKGKRPRRTAGAEQEQGTDAGVEAASVQTDA
jgi:hypothetical protein